MYDFLDDQVLKVGQKEEIMTIATLATRCLNLNGKRRPTMKEVAMELERIQALQKDINVKQICDEIESCDIVSTSTETSTCDSIALSVLHIE